MHEQTHPMNLEPGLAPFQAWFHQYTTPYMEAPREETYEIKLKIDHSLRVLENGARIARSLKLEGMDLLTAEVASLLHDVGRFPQFAQYKTFKDADSTNHGRLGAKILAGEALLRTLPKINRKQVIGAVHCHNMRKVPSNLSPVLDRLTRIVRDADKLDIWGVLLEHLRPGARRHKQIVLSLIDDPARYTPKLVDKVQNREMLSYDDLVYINDLVLSLCGWIYDLNFAASFSMLDERGYIDTLISFLPQNKEIVSLRRETGAYLDGRRSRS